MARVAINGLGRIGRAFLKLALNRPELEVVAVNDLAERARAAVATKTYHSVQLSASIGGIGFPGPAAQSAPDMVALADDLLGQGCWLP